MKNIILITVSMLIFTNPLISLAYDDDNVHPAINLHSAKQSVLSTENVLLNFGFSQGLDAELKGENTTQKIIKWIEQGGIDEDADTRSLNHFHDPFKIWQNAGMLSVIGKSSLLWAQHFPQEFSWTGARQAYREALEKGDEAKLAKTFETLGHLMHLISDKSVPAHVRNDAHIPPVDTEQYEKWAKSSEERFNKMMKLNLRDKTTDELREEFFTEFEVSPTIFDKAVWYSAAPSPISALWDLNIYEGDNPDPDITWNSDIGLAEFANANFFSDGRIKGTIFDGYQHPAVGDTNWENPEIIPAEDDSEDFRLYLWRTVNGVKKYRLVSIGYLASDFDGGSHYSIKYILDDKVYEDYAKQLIPRAVGYSTALLDYFFRGRIDIVPNPDGEGYVIENLGSEAMDGEFSLYYDDIEGNRHQVGNGPVWSGYIGVNNPETPGNNFSEPFSFDLPTYPAPSNTGGFMLVFQGLMGKEDDAVAGKLLKTKQFVYFKVGDYVTVWDVENNMVANRIPMNNGGYAVFPTIYSDISNWYEEQVNVGQPLFSQQNLGIDFYNNPQTGNNVSNSNSLMSQELKNPESFVSGAREYLYDVFPCSETANLNYSYDFNYLHSYPDGYTGEDVISNIPGSGDTTCDIPILDQVANFTQTMTGDLAFKFWRYVDEKCAYASNSGHCIDDDTAIAERSYNLTKERRVYIPYWRPHSWRIFAQNISSESFSKIELEHYNQSYNHYVYPGYGTEVIYGLLNTALLKCGTQLQVYTNDRYTASSPWGEFAVIDLDKVDLQFNVGNIEIYLVCNNQELPGGLHVSKRSEGLVVNNKPVGQYSNNVIVQVWPFWHKIHTSIYDEIFYQEDVIYDGDVYLLSDADATSEITPVNISNHATVGTYGDTSVVDPFSLSRNSNFEAAIESVTNANFASENPSFHSGEVKIMQQIW